jgi:hypothetical protein
MEFPITASCQCGQVSYRLFEPPQKVIACHCKACQTLSTGPLSITATVASDTIEFTGEMQEWSRMADSGNRNHAKFCPSCGHRIYHFNPQMPGIIKLKLKPVGLTDDRLFEPTLHIWTQEKLSWYALPQGVPFHEQQ